MNCYYAPQEPAVGICKSCGKGLSPVFATDLGDGLACKDRCEDRVRLINAIIDSNSTMRATNSKVLAVSNTQMERNAIFTVLAGLFFAALGYFMGLPKGNPVGIILVLMGVLSVVRGILGFTKSARYPDGIFIADKAATVNR